MDAAHHGTKSESGFCMVDARAASPVPPRDFFCSRSAHRGKSTENQFFPPPSASRPQQARRGPVPRIESYQRPLGAHPRCRSRPQRYQRPKWTAQSPASAIGPRDVRQRPPASGGASRCRAARRRRRRGTLIGQEASPTMGPSRRMRERPVRLHARLRDRALIAAVAADAHGGHEMPAPRPRAGCDLPRGHGNTGGVGRTGCGQNLVRFA